MSEVPGVAGMVRCRTARCRGGVSGGGRRRDATAENGASLGAGTVKMRAHLETAIRCRWRRRVLPQAAFAPHAALLEEVEASSRP
jgi:hypothetical protein